MAESGAQPRAINFLFGDRELWIGIQDLLSAPVDVIVNPSNEGLSHGGGVAQHILQQAGDELQQQSAMLIRQYGSVPVGGAMYTTAGKLPYQAVIHAVGPRMGCGEEQSLIERAVSRSLLLCETNDWNSIAFPAISTGVFSVPVEICARAFARAVTRFWDARQECAVEKIMLCMTERNYLPFVKAFDPDGGYTETVEEVVAQDSKEEPVGEFSLSEEEITQLDTRDINDWFK